MKIKKHWFMVVMISLLAAGCSTSIENPSSKRLGRSVHPYAPLNPELPIDTQIRHTEAISAFKSGEIRRQGNLPFEISNLYIATHNSDSSSSLVNEAKIADGRIGISLLDSRGQTVAIEQNNRSIYLPTNRNNHYRVHYRNYTANVIFELVPVNGVIDKRTQSSKRFAQKGHLLYPGQTITLEDSYNTGVTGNAFFVMKDPARRYQVSPAPTFASEKGYAHAPRY